ncbi:MAG: hypothetical protein MRJ65_15075 [Candidatus Brocadiaceae bacterium]|nr:hypothetical protein [Candidatus Brocadiaceae bacterium]
MLKRKEKEYGELGEQMVEEMDLRNFSPRTIKAYLGHMVSLARLTGTDPRICPYSGNGQMVRREMLLPLIYSPPGEG